MRKILNLNLIIMSCKTWKYKYIFAKDYTPNWSEKVFVIEKVKNTVPWTYVISYINAKEVVRIFHELQKASPTLEKNSRVEKFIKKGDKLYVKWKGYDNSLIKWIDKKDVVL